MGHRQADWRHWNNFLPMSRQPAASRLLSFSTVTLITRRSFRSVLINRPHSFIITTIALMIGSPICNISACLGAVLWWKLPKGFCWMCPPSSQKNYSLSGTPGCKYRSTILAPVIRRCLFLKKFDIDYLKIDRSFVSNLTGDSTGMALCEAMILMAHKLDMKVIAEGIRT